MARSNTQGCGTSNKNSRGSRAATETASVDGYNTTLVFCQHTDPDSKATALKLASRLFTTRRKER
jgi:hypothetical protein